MNSAAKIHRTQNSIIDMDKVLGLGGFDLNRALEVDPKFLEPEYPFEWSGLFQLEAGDYRFKLKPGPDPAMNINFRSATSESAEAMNATIEKAVLAFSDKEVSLQDGEKIEPGEQLSKISLDGKENFEYIFKVPKTGAYVLFSEHYPEEFEAVLTDQEGRQLKPSFIREYKPDHNIMMKLAL